MRKPKDYEQILNSLKEDWKDAADYEAISHTLLGKKKIDSTETTYKFLTLSRDNVSKELVFWIETVAKHSDSDGIRYETLSEEACKLTLKQTKILTKLNLDNIELLYK